MEVTQLDTIFFFEKKLEIPNPNNKIEKMLTRIPNCRNSRFRIRAEFPH